MKNLGVLLGLVMPLLAGRPEATPVPDPPPHRAHARVLMIDDDIEAFALMIMASQILDINVGFVGYYEPGVIVVDMLNLAPGESTIGTTLTLDSCHISLWSSRDPYVLAHELGHALGLPHNFDPDNLMYYRKKGDMKVTDYQKRHMANTADHLLQCADSPQP